MKRILILFFLMFGFLYPSKSIDLSYKDAAKPSLTKEEKQWLQNNTVTIGIESAKPYIFYNRSKDDIDGLYADILKLVLQRTGLKVKYLQGEWDDLLKDFKEKKLDLLPATFYSKDREKFGRFSDPYYQVREYIYTKNTDETIRSFEDISGKKAALVKGYATIAKIKEKFPHIDIVQANNLDESVSMLLNGEVDALIDYHLVVETYIRDNSILGLKAVAQSELDAVSVHYLSHIDKPILNSILQKGLKSISRKQKNDLLRQWVRMPYEKELLTHQEKSYINSKSFNIYINNWEPFTEYRQEQNSFSGLAVDIWKYIASQSGINYNFIYEKNFDEMLNRIKKDPQGVLISTSYTKERGEYALFSKPYISFPVAVATKIKEKYIINFKELEGKSLAVGKNYTAHKLLQKQYPKIKFIPVKSTNDALNLLAEGKVFAAADILPVLINKMGKYHYNDLKISGAEDVNFNVKIMVNKQSEQLVNILNKAIETIGKDQIRKINNKWLTHTKYVESIDYELLIKIIVPILVFLVFILILYYNQKRSNMIINGQKEKLKELNERFGITFDAVKDGIWDWNIKTDEAYFSKRWKSMLGYGDDEIKNEGKSFFNLLHEDDKQKTLEIQKKHFENPDKNKYFIEVRLKCKDGSYKWILTRGEAVLDKEGNPIRMLGSHTDISERKKIEEYIKNSNTILEMIAAGKPAPEVYDAIAMMYEARHPGMRCSLLELEEGKLKHGGAPSMPKEYCDAVNGLQNGPNVGSCGASTYTKKRVLVENIETDPKWSDIKEAALPHGMRCCWSEPIISSSGEVLGAFGMYYDHPALPNEEESKDLLSAARLASIVMERDQAQRRMFQDQKLISEQSKLAAMGEMIGNIAHQWRQPLSIISTAATGMKIQKEFDNLTDHDFNESCLLINDNAQYLSQTIEDFKNFIKGERKKVKLSIKDNIDSFLSLVSGSIKNNDINMVLNIEDVTIESYPNELIQCYINIFNNSKDILKEMDTDRYIFISIKTEDDKINISFKDNGGGILEDVMPHIFEPYFTTKHESKGTGLGLHMTYSLIVEGMNGTIKANNVTYKYEGNSYTGAQFTIQLPIS